MTPLSVIGLNVFLIHHELSENEKKIGFSHVFWGDLESAELTPVSSS